MLVLKPYKGYGIGEIQSGMAFSRATVREQRNISIFIPPPHFPSVSSIFSWLSALSVSCIEFNPELLGKLYLGLVSTESGSRGFARSQQQSELAASVAAPLQTQPSLICKINVPEILKRKANLWIKVSFEMEKSSEVPP